MELPFEVGALYNRQKEIHAVLAGSSKAAFRHPRSIR